MQYVREYIEGRLPKQPPPTWWSNRKCLQLARDLALSPVLDCGAGLGWLTMHLVEWGYDVTASDYDENAIADWKANMAAAGIDLPIHREDITNLGFDDERFASVFCFSVLEHIPDVDAAIGELHRVLRPGGRLVVIVPNVLGAFSLINDRNWRRPLKVRDVENIRTDHVHLHTPRWWERRLARRFEIERTVPIEILSPLFARLFGYEIHERWTHADVRIAEHLPRVIASDNMFIMSKAA
jgi:2-polyprenyl-3-methyl-5-hydroxy-6-metoxy-1,4-benzoquinol methylase